MRSCFIKLEKGKHLAVFNTIKSIHYILLAGFIFGCTTTPETQEAGQTKALEEQTESTAYNRVWLNTRSGVYHCAGTRWYGNTYNSYFLDEKRARAAGYHSDRGNQCAEPILVTTYVDGHVIDKADSVLLGNWSGEVYEIKGFPSKMGLRIDLRGTHGYSGHASVIGATRNPTGLPNCQDTDITLETFSDGYYYITFDGEGCDGKGKLRYKENRLSGQARINSVQIFIKLVRKS